MRGWGVGNGLRKIKRNQKFLSLHVVVKMSVRKPIRELHVLDSHLLSDPIELGVDLLMLPTSNLFLQTSDVGLCNPTNMCSALFLTT